MDSTQPVETLELFLVRHFFLRNLSRNDNDSFAWKNLFCGYIEELLPTHKRLSGPRQCLPVLWTTGDATLTRFAAINWRTREFFSGDIEDFIPVFSKIPDASFINENELIAQAAMIVERAGNSIGGGTYTWNGQYEHSLSLMAQPWAC